MTFTYGLYKDQTFDWVRSNDPTYLLGQNSVRIWYDYKYGISFKRRLNDDYNDTMDEINKKIDEYLSQGRYCLYCAKSLVNIGHGRINGANHVDWNKRRLHKKCWKILIKKCRKQYGYDSDNYTYSANDESSDDETDGELNPYFISPSRIVDKHFRDEYRKRNNTTF